METKLCNSCLEIKPHHEYYKRTTKKGVVKPKSTCKACEIESKKAIRRSKEYDAIDVKSYADYLAEQNTHHTDKYFRRKVTS